MLRLEHAVDDRGRATAGLPALSSSKRREITDYQLRQIYQRSLQSEYRGNEETATAPDGAIDDVTDLEQVVGIPLVGPRIITRLKRLNKNLWFERSNADSSKTGIYVLEPSLSGGMEKKFLCGMETELNPEFSVRVVDEAGAAKGIISGWRRILMRLIRARLISEPGAFALFGPPSRDSENWARFTQ
jgi:hypothetical protein